MIILQNIIVVDIPMFIIIGACAMWRPLLLILNLSLSLSLSLSSAVPQEKTLLSAVQNGSIETVDSILSELCTHISCSSSPSSSSAPANDRGDGVAAKPVTETGKTPETMDTSESPSSKTSSDGGKGEAGGTKGAEIGRESKSDQNLRRKRKNEASTEPHLRKRRKSKDEREAGKPEESATSCPPAVTMEIGGKLVTTETPPMKGAGFDNAPVLLLQTGVDNCNILHVCCGGGRGTVEELTGRRLDILDRILSCKPVRPVITRLVSC